MLNVGDFVKYNGMYGKCVNVDSADMIQVDFGIDKKTPIESIRLKFYRDGRFHFWTLKPELKKVRFVPFWRIKK